MGVTADDTSFFTSSTNGGDLTTAFASTKQRTDDADPLAPPKDKIVIKKKVAKKVEPQQSKTRQTLKFKVRFDSHRMLFDDTYPPDLQPVLPAEEWEGVMRHLNTDLNQHIQQSAQDLTSWTTGMLASSALVVGVFVVPVVWWKKHKHDRNMHSFWEQVRAHFSEVNKKTFIRRGLEWKVVEERRKMDKKDCCNPVYFYRVELLWRQNVVKSKKEMARSAAAAGYPGSSSGGDSAMAAGSVGATAAGASAAMAMKRREKEIKRDSKRKSASRPPSNIGSVKEVSPERESGPGTVGAVGAVGTAAVLLGASDKASDEEPSSDKETEMSSESDMLLPSRPVSGIVPRADKDDTVAENADLGQADAEPEQVEAGQVEPEQAEADQVEPEQAEADQIEPEQVESDQVEPEQVEADQVEPEQAEPEAQEVQEEKKVEQVAEEKQEPQEELDDLLKKESTGLFLSSDSE